MTSSPKSPWITMDRHSKTQKGYAMRLALSINGRPPGTASQLSTFSDFGGMYGVYPTPKSRTYLSVWL